jgi:uncharacterized protein DUF547
MPSPRPSRRANPVSWWPIRTGIAFGIGLVIVVGAALAESHDTAAFDALLKAHVKEGNVDYPAFQASVAFRSYAEALGKPAGLPGKSETLAYYINAYNALAIAGILEGLSPASLLGRARYFKIKVWPLDGRTISLYDLEHEKIRPLGEPRIHFAIVCASRSCPPLRSEAYAAARLDAQLDEQARSFINDPARNRFDKATRTAHLSEIFDWYDMDFRAATGSTQRFIAGYVADADVARDLAADRYKVEWIPYDWRLNGIPLRQ